MADQTKMKPSAATTGVDAPPETKGSRHATNRSSKLRTLLP